MVKKTIIMTQTSHKIDKWSIIYVIIVFGSLGLLIGGLIGYVYTPTIIKSERKECFNVLNKCHYSYTELQYKCNGQYELFQSSNLTMNLTEYKTIYK